MKDEEATPTPYTAIYHTVAAGESLESIAARYYGDARQWPRIVAANRHVVTGPALLAHGATIRIPS